MLLRTCEPSWQQHLPALRRRSALHSSQERLLLAVCFPTQLQFLHNVSINLKEGGYFIGTVPDGKRVNECIKT